MSEYLDHNKENINEALGIDLQSELGWVETYFKKYSKNKIKLSQVFEGIIRDLRNKELDDASDIFSKYEIRLAVAGFLFGCYHTSYTMMTSGMVDMSGYADIVEALKEAKLKDKEDGKGDD